MRLRGEAFREHLRVFYGHGPTLSHHGGARVGGVTHQDHAAGTPLLGFEPIDRAATDITVTSAD
jgi:hypothetical protein